ncbi:MAG TPA: tetratricopeptide repeat protein [Balneolaceae bacterium]
MAYCKVLSFRVMIASFILIAGISIPHTFAQNASQADRLYGKAIDLQYKAQYEGSSALLHQAIRHYKAAAKFSEVAKCYNSLSFNARLQNKLDKAEGFAQTVLKIYKEYANIPALEAVGAYHNLGIIQTDRNHFEKALHWLKKGMAIAKRAELPPPLWVNLYTAIGSIYHEQGKYEQAMEQYRLGVEALDHDNPAHQKDLAVLYNHIGVNYVSMGRYDQALLFYQKELEMNRGLYGEGHPNVAAVYNNLGGLSYRSGDIGKAIGYFKKAVTSFEQTYGINHPAVGIAFNNIGVSYFQLGDFEQSIKYLIKSAEIKKQVRGENHPDLAISYNNIGSIYLEMEEYEKAEDYLSRSLVIRKKALGDSHPKLANTYNSLGLLFLKQNEPDSAITYFKREVEITRKYRGDDHPYVADALNNIAKAYAEQGFFDRALTFHQQALEVLSNGFKTNSYSGNPSVKNIRYPVYAVNVLFDKGKTLYQFFNKGSNTVLLKAALASYRRLSELLDFLQTGFQSKKSKLLMSRESHEMYEQAIKAAYRLFEETGERAYLEQAFFFAEKSKTRVILELIKTQQAKGFAGIPDSLIRYENQLRNQITDVHQQLNNAIDTPGEAVETGQLRNSLFALKRSLDNHLRYLEVEFPRYHNLKYNQEIPSVDAIQEILQKQNLTLVEYFYGKESAWVFVMDANNLHLAPLPFDSLLKKNIRHFRKAIMQQSDSLYLSLGFDLYEKLLHPVVKHIQSPNILFVPDGALNLLPFEALLVQSTDDRENFSYTDLPYLINYFTVSYSPSFSLSTLSETSDGPAYTSNFAAFAPVTFSSEVVAGRNRGEKGPNWPPLFSTEYEVRQIAALFEEDDEFWSSIFSNESESKLFMREEATEKRFKTADLGNYRFLHLATHAFATDTGAYESGIVFYPGTDPSEDGILYAEEVYNLDLQNELAVLSACETGTGKVMKGEGIIGLSRAFQFAGVENLLVSLWKVDDRSTARLMIDFYRNYLKGASVSFSNALRTAKLELIAHPAYAHPKFWAPFVFIGR